MGDPAWEDNLPQVLGSRNKQSLRQHLERCSAIIQFDDAPD